MTDLTGRTALVTGASRGIGRAIAVGLARAGADVALSARDEALLAEVRGEVEALGRRAVVLPADVADADKCAQLAADAIAGLGVLDVLVNNAVSTTGLKRWAEAEEMVGPTVFLASDASSLVTGQALAVDNGETAG